MHWKNFCRRTVYYFCAPTEKYNLTPFDLADGEKQSQYFLYRGDKQKFISWGQFSYNLDYFELILTRKLVMTHQLQ